VTMDWRVLVFTLSVSLLTGILFGLLPAVQASGPDLNFTLKEGGSRSGGGPRRNKARAILVVTEVALARSRVYDFRLGDHRRFVWPDSGLPDLAGRPHH
jgi:hypothetical protein